MRILYRLGQFWRNVTAQPLSQSELNEVALILNPAETTLFQKMSISDQRHAYRVCALLKANGQTDEDLLAAALLHDVGKIRVPLSVWDRTAAVLGETLMPQSVQQWGSGDQSGWKRTFVVREQHAAWGASLAVEAGSRPDVVRLIAHHQDSLPAAGGRHVERLSLLQWADDQN